MSAFVTCLPLEVLGATGAPVQRRHRWRCADTGRIVRDGPTPTPRRRAARRRKPVDKWRIASAASAAHALHAAVVYLGPSTLMSPMRQELGLSITQIALPLNVFRVINCALLIPAGVALDRVGAARLLLPSMALTAVCAVLGPACSQLWHLVALQAVYGAAFLFCGLTSMLMLVNEAFGGEAGDGAGSGAGVVLAGWSLAGCIAPGVVGVAGAQWGWRAATALLNGLFAALALPLTYAYLRGSGRPRCVPLEESEGRAEPLFSKRYVATMAMMMCMSFSYHVVLDHLPMFMREDLGMPFQMSSLVLSAMNLCGFVAKLAGGWMADHFPIGGLFAVFSVLTALSCVFLVRVTPAGGLLLASSPLTVTMFAVCFGLTYSVVFTLITVALREFGLRRLGLRSNLNLMLLFGFGSIGSGLAGVLRMTYGSYLPSFALASSMWLIILAFVAYYCYHGRTMLVNKG